MGEEWQWLTLFLPPNRKFRPLLYCSFALLVAPSSRAEILPFNPATRLPVRRKRNFIANSYAGSELFMANAFGASQLVGCCQESQRVNINFLPEYLVDLEPNTEKNHYEQRFP